MRPSWIAIAAGLISLVPRAASADPAGSQSIRDHVDATLLRLDVPAMTAPEKQALLADRRTLNLGLLVPCYGSYALDAKVYGELQPAAVVFDWVLGGIVPVGLGVGALADRDLPSGTRAGLAWTAAALYVTSRVGVLIIANGHITDYNAAMRWRLGLSAAGPRTWGVAATGRW
ncbi:MAG: hypothetical protein ABJE95_19005 [Byssovorax sp.]